MRFRLSFSVCICDVFELTKHWRAWTLHTNQSFTFALARNLIETRTYRDCLAQDGAILSVQVKINPGIKQQYLGK